MIFPWFAIFSACADMSKSPRDTKTNNFNSICNTWYKSSSWNFLWTYLIYFSPFIFWPKDNLFASFFSFITIILMRRNNISIFWEQILISFCKTDNIRIKFINKKTYLFLKKELPNLNSNKICLAMILGIFNYFMWYLHANLLDF